MSALVDCGVELIHEFAESLLLRCVEKVVRAKPLQDDEGFACFGAGDIEFGF